MNKLTSPPKQKKPKDIPVAPKPNDSTLKSSSGPYPELSPADRAKEMRWKAEDALRDIERAETHKRDKELMKHVKKVAGEKVSTLSSIVGNKR